MASPPCPHPRWSLPVSFRFDRSSCVALGTFNMYIVQPRWLADRGILARDTTVAIASKLDEPSFRFSSPQLKSQWEVTPRKIEVSTRVDSEDCGSMISKVIESLPWTPLRSVASNFFFKSDGDHPPELEDFCRLKVSPPDGATVEQRSSHLAIRQGEHIFNLQLSFLRGGVEIHGNATTETSQKGGPELAVAAAAKFLDHRVVLDRLIRDIFKIEVSYGH